MITIASVELERGFLLPRVDHVYLKREGAGTFAGWDEIASALQLAGGDTIDDPWPYWAVTRIENRVLERFLPNQRPPAPIDSLDAQDVHASEDVA